MQKRALVLALALTVPLALYGIPYAYAASVGQTTVILTSHTIAAGDVAPIDLIANCPTGDYATGGGAGHDLDTIALVPAFSGPTRGGFPTFSGTPDGWYGSFQFISATGLVGGVLEVFAVCQAPIVVAGIGVPQFGSLYIAIALGAAVYFLLARRYASPKTAEVRLG
jgi:hypothetical protein